LRPATPVAAALAAVFAVAAPLADASRPTATDAGALSRRPVAASPAWRGYVLDSRSPLVYPRRVIVQRPGGHVTNPSGLRAPGGAATTIEAAAKGRPRLVLDLGRDTGGTVEVGLTRTDGTQVRLAYSESRAELTPTGDYDGSSLGSDDENSRFDLLSKAGRWRSGVHGAQRWILLQLEGAGKATIDYVRVRIAHYRPRPADYVGRFLSSDKLLNRVWYGSVYTLNLDSVRHGGNLVVIDGAKRDRWVWIGDVAVADRVAYYSTPRATRILRDSLDVFTCQQYADGYLPAFSEIGVRCPRGAHLDDPLGQAVPLGSYTAWWIVALGDYYRFSGDAAFAREQMPVVRRALAWLASRSPDGLYEASLPGEINWHPFDTAAGEDAHSNAVYYQALRSAATLERSFGTDAAAQADDAAARRVRSLVIARLWDGAAGALRINTADPNNGHGQDGNVYAAASGLLDGSRARRALAFVRRSLWTRHGPVNVDRADDPYMSRYISPYISSWELQARFAAGQGATALDLIRRLHGWMVDRDPGGVMWEKMTTRGTPQPYSDEPGNTSLAHAWSAGAAPALSAWVLGLQPTAPGWRRWTVAPQPSNLRFAQGQVQARHGVVVSRWVVGPHKSSFRLTAGGPGKGSVVVPLLGRRRTIAMDGRVVWRGKRATGSVVFGGLRGIHTFAWSVD
jgi:alpha-L-rhamnosidase